MKKPVRGWFVTGTDTDVGKTHVACRMLAEMRSQGSRVGAYKPAASGAGSIEESDPYRLWQAIGQGVPLELVNPQSFTAPLAPPMAAELECRSVDERLLLTGVEAWCDRCDFLLIEGAGGLMSPISWSMTNADLAQAIGYPLVIVANNRLGVVHQVLATVVAAIKHHLDIAEIVLNAVESDEDAVTRATNERLLRPFLKRYLPSGVTVRSEPYSA